MSSPLEVVPTIDSTTAELLRRDPEDAPVGAALLALAQTGGRGRSERVWESPTGGMYLSVVVSTEIPEGLSLLGAKALLELVAGYGGKARLRWPNDVTLRGRKLGGVLPVVRYSGNRLERAVLGVGLNVFSSPEHFTSELRAHLTTLALECPVREWDVVEVARRYLELLALELQFLEDQGLAAFVERCQGALEGRGEQRIPVLVEPGKSPVELAPVDKLDPDGALRLVDGSRLDCLGREQRLRFVDPSPSHFAPP